MKGDFSRSTFDPMKPRSSVRMQQGRVLVDADWNEQVDLQERLRRSALRDIVGSSGVPLSHPDSFLVTENGGQLEVEGGRIWVDGLLCEVDSIVLDPEEIPDAADTGTYAVVLEAWERHLTAIEDPSIRELALGGPDTCTRTETVCRLRLIPAAGDRCADVGPLDYGDGTGRLAAKAVPPPSSDDPCVVPSQAGYTGLENHLYRIEIHRGGDTADPANLPAYKWSRDNGSVLSALLSKIGNQLTIDSLGRDSVRGFRHVEWVELGQDSLDLACRPGPLVAVDGVDPLEDGEGGILTITEGDGSAAFVPDPLQHPKVRRWDSAAIDIVPGGFTPLGEHNLEIRFAPGTYREGEYWWIPARAFVGEHFGSIEWPQTLGQPDDVAAHGPKKARSRLAVVRFDGADFEVLDDCRCVFPPLCKVEGDGCCCTITVGPERSDVRTIAEAIAALPPQGGEICLREGIYRESVTLDLSNVTIHGCGPRTVWMADDSDAPPLTLGQVRAVTVEDLAFAVEGSAVMTGAKAKQEDLRFANLRVSARNRAAFVLPRVNGLTIRDCTIHYEKVDANAPDFRLEPALFVGGRVLRIEGNTITVEQTPREPAFLPSTPIEGVGGVFIDPQVATAPGLAPGSVQIVGRSRDVELRCNLIRGGAWHGVVLGSVSQMKFPDGNVEVAYWRLEGGAMVGPGVGEMKEHYKALDIAPRDAPITELDGQRYLDVWLTEDNEGFLLSDGDLEDVRLIDNRIENMGGSGISAVHFFDLDEVVPDLVGVQGLLLRHNRIENCLRLPPWFEAFFASPGVAFGAVALAEVRRLEAESNHLEGCGSGWGVYPVCGAYVQTGKALRFTGNRIIDNGSRPGDDQDPEEGRRGGIVIGLASVGTYDAALDFGKARYPGRRQDGIPALVVQDNVVVAPQGRALDVIALGPVSITDNQLTAQGNLDLRTAFRSRGGIPMLGLDQASKLPAVDRFRFELDDFRNVLGGAAVFVLDLGFSNELYLQAMGFSGFSGRQFRTPGSFGDRRPGRAWVGGNVLFADNQVVLDGFSEGQSLPLSSVSLVTLSDLAMESNQCDCDIPPGEFVFTNALTLGWSLRVAENRFTEPIFGGLLSSISLGLMNRTTDNQGTHCFLGVGLKPISRMRPNEVLLDIYYASRDGSPCYDLIFELDLAKKKRMTIPPVPSGPSLDGVTLDGVTVDGTATVDGVGGGPGVITLDPNTPTPRPTDEQLRELDHLPKVGDRLRLVGLDRLETSLVSDRGRAAFAALAAPEEDQAPLLARFAAADRAHLETMDEIFDQEIGVDAAGFIAIAGRLLGDADALPRASNVMVTLSKVDDWQNPIFVTEADRRRQRYARSVEPGKFAKFFEGETYLQATLLVDDTPWARAMQEIGDPAEPFRRLDIVYGKGPIKGEDPPKKPRPDRPRPERPKKPRPQKPRAQKPGPSKPRPDAPQPEKPQPKKPAPGKAGAGSGAAAAAAPAKAESPAKGKAAPRKRAPRKGTAKK